MSEENMNQEFRLKKKKKKKKIKYKKKIFNLINKKKLNNESAA